MLFNNKLLKNRAGIPGSAISKNYKRKLNKSKAASEESDGL